MADVHWKPKSYRFGIEAPALNAPVRFRVYIPDCLPGAEPIADYHGHGRFIGECADGFMIRVEGCTKQVNIGRVVYVRACHDEYEHNEGAPYQQHVLKAFDDLTHAAKRKRDDRASEVRRAARGAL